MTIAPPRYAAGAFVRSGRLARVVTILGREITTRAGIWTGLVVALAFLWTAVLMTVRLEFSFGSSPNLALFALPYGGTLWPLEILLVTAATGSGAIAEDLSSRSITLYLSRPIHLEDYLAGKALGLAFWIGLVAIGPGIVAAVLGATLGLVSAELALAAIASYVAVGLLTTFFFVAFALALSAWTARALYAGVAIFGVILALQLAVLVISVITGNPQVPYLSPFVDLRNVALAAFQSPAVPATIPWVSAVVVAAAAAALVGVTWMRLGRVEVAGE